MNKIQKMSLLLASLVTLSGCGLGSSEEGLNNNIDNAKVSSSIVTTEEVNQIFEPGTHIVRMFCLADDYEKNTPYDISSNGNYVGPYIDVPIGYIFDSIIPITRSIGSSTKTYGFIYVFVNESRVEAKGTYNENGELEFLEPGTPLELVKRYN